MITYTPKELLTPGQVIPIPDAIASIKAADPAALVAAGAKVHSSDYVRTAYFQAAFRMVIPGHGPCKVCGEPLRDIKDVRLMNRAEIPQGALHLAAKQARLSHRYNPVCSMKARANGGWARDKVA